MKNVSCLTEARFQFGRKTPLVWLDRFLLLGRILHLIISNHHSHLPESSSSSTQTLYLIIYISPPKHSDPYHEAFSFASRSIPTRKDKPFPSSRALPCSLFTIRPHFPLQYSQPSPSIPSSTPPLPQNRQVICLKNAGQNATKRRMRFTII